MAQILDFESEVKEYQLGKDGPIVRLITNDPNLPNRLTEAFNNIEKYIADMQKNYGLDGATLDNIGTVSTDEVEKDLEFIKKADEYVKSQVDYIFGYVVSKDVFGVVSAFTVNRNSGEYFFERLINTFIPVINDEYGTSLEKLKSRVKTYTDRQGMHPALRKQYELRFTVIA